MKVLHLTLKRQYFDMIASGEKPEEYRAIKPYWVDRLLVQKNPDWNIWEEPGCYEELINDLKHPTLNHRSTEELLEYFHVKPVQYDYVSFRNGYSSKSPVMEIEWNKLTVGIGEVKWGAQAEYSFIIKLGKILSIKNYNQ